MYCEFEFKLAAAVTRLQFKLSKLLYFSVNSCVYREFQLFVCRAVTRSTVTASNLMSASEFFCYYIVYTLTITSNKWGSETCIGSVLKFGSQCIWSPKL